MELIHMWTAVVDESDRRMTIAVNFRIYCAFQKYVNSKIQNSTDKWVFRCRQSSARRLLLASDYCRALFRYLNCAQRFDYARSTVVGSWEESPNTWLTVAKNAIVGWALNVRVRMLLKGAVSNWKQEAWKNQSFNGIPTGDLIAPVLRKSRVRIPLKLLLFQASFFQLLKLKNLLQGSFLTSSLFV